MPFSKLEIDRRIVSWNQVMYTLMEAPARNRPRLWAVANLLAGLDEGMTREEFAVGYCIGARQLRRWIKRFNEGGLEGLLFRSRRRRGPKRKISADKYNSELLPLIQELRASDGKASARKLWQLAKGRLGVRHQLRGNAETAEPPRPPVPTTAEDVLVWKGGRAEGRLCNALNRQRRGGKPYYYRSGRGGNSLAIPQVDGGSAELDSLGIRLTL